MTGASMYFAPGNVLSNGRGLGLTTADTMTLNRRVGRSERSVRAVLKQYLGFDQLVVLEPLSGEPTGHVDMFATFVSAKTVVVGAFDPSRDPVNAKILNRNAARLADVRTSMGALRVVRIPMPRRGRTVWPTYTNVLFADGLLLIPSYKGLPQINEKAAIEVYRRELPDWMLATIDCQTLIRSGGALHCISLNVPNVRRTTLKLERLKD